MRIKDYIRNKFIEGKTKDNIQFFLISIPVITIIISLMEFNPDLGIWIVEVLRNLVLTICITALLFIFSTIFSLSKLEFRFTFIIKVIVASVISGVGGGFAAWKLNDLLFGFNITHPLYFFILTSSLALIFGLSIFTYSSLLDKLRKTAIKLAERELASEKLKNLKVQAELEALRAKVNPHFFFNTLNSIASLISIDPQKAEKVIESLSRLFRYSLDSSNKDFVSLGQEVEMVDEYLKIEKVRWGDRIKYSIVCDDRLYSIPVPGMIIQPLVENSIIHGLSQKSEGGEINVICTEEGEFLHIQVKDNGGGFDQKISRQGFGIKGIKDRLKLLFPGNHDFSIHSENDTSVIIKIPKL